MSSERSRPIAWMAHPLKGDVEGNLVRARAWLKWLLRTFPHVDFCADWILWCELLDDSKPEERERGLRFEETMVVRCDRLFLVGGRISEGMERARRAAKAAGKEITDLTGLGPETPTSWNPLTEWI